MISLPYQPRLTYTTHLAHLSKHTTHTTHSIHTTHTTPDHLPISLHSIQTPGTVYGASLMAGMASPKVNYSMLGRTPSDLSQFATDFMNSPRRERFVFRPRHLEILERSFQSDSYPSHDRRDTIASSCNTVTEDIG